MAEAWRADMVAGAGVRKPVVIKRILPHRAAQPGFVEMFIAEARLTAQLNHGNIAQVFDFGEQDGEYFIALELVDGLSLRELFTRAAADGFWHLPYPLALLAVLEASKALHYAHTRTDERGRALGIVHRDVSPDNLLVSLDGEVKVVDFGVAKADRAGNDSTEPGVIKGKYLYLSPEQALGEPVDARSDVFALGIVLYELVCGGLPFGDEPIPALRQMSRGAMRPPLELNPGLPPALVAVLLRALQLNRAARFPTALAMQEAVAEVLFELAPRAGPGWMAAFVGHLLDRPGTGGGLSNFHQLLETWRPLPRDLPSPEGPRKATDATAAAAVKRTPTRPAAPAAGGVPIWVWGVLATGAVLTASAIYYAQGVTSPVAVAAPAPQPLARPAVDAGLALAPRIPATVPVPIERPNSAEPEYLSLQAPTQFVLDTHHRFTVDDSPSLGDRPTEFRVKRWPGTTPQSFGFGKGDAVATFDRGGNHGIVIITGAAGKLTTQVVEGKARWPGGSSWIVSLAAREDTTDQYSFYTSAQIQVQKVALELPNLMRRLELSDRYTVERLDPAVGWTLRVTPRAEAGKVVVSPILSVQNRQGSEAPLLDGKPLEYNLAVVDPGTHRLEGASTLWMTIPTLTGLETATLEVELSR